MKKLVEYLAVCCLSLLFFAFYQFQTPYLPDTDGYYHIKMAYMLREYGFISDFRWAHLSLWCEHFSDKEFLYHVYLIPFTYFDDMLFGAKLATVIMASIVFVSFYRILRLNNIKHAWFWLLLLSASGGYFLYRVNVLRPQGLSIVFVLWSLHYILNSKNWQLAVLCFVYTFSYTAYHLPFIFACIVYFYSLLFEKENRWKTPLIVLGATITGMLCSPFFPNNITFFYLQNFYILWQGTAGQVDLHMGGEFAPMDTQQLIIVNMTVVLSFVAAFFMAMYIKRKWDSKTLSLFLVSLSLILLSCISKRFAEYSIPVSLLFCAFFFSPLWGEFDWAKWKVPSAILAFAVIMVLGYNSYINTIGEFNDVRPSGLKDAAIWLKENTDSNELIYTADWDDAPELFYFNHRNRYLVFLDPNFMYYWNPRVWEKWDSLSNGHYGSNTNA